MRHGEGGREGGIEGWVLNFKKVLASNEAVQAQQDRFIRGEAREGGRESTGWTEGVVEVRDGKVEKV